MHKITRNLVFILLGVLFGIPIIIWGVATVLEYGEAIDKSGESLVRYLYLEFPRTTLVGSFIVLLGMFVFAARGLITGD